MTDSTDHGTGHCRDSLTASAGLPVASSARVDFRGVVIGPWTGQVKRTNALLNRTRSVPSVPFRS